MNCPVCNGSLGDTPQPQPCHPWSAEQRLLLRRLRAAGLPIKVCAHVLGVSIQTARRRLYNDTNGYAHRVYGANFRGAFSDRAADWARTAKRDAHGRILPKERPQRAPALD